MLRRRRRLGKMKSNKRRRRSFGCGMHHLYLRTATSHHTTPKCNQHLHRKLGRKLYEGATPTIPLTSSLFSLWSTMTLVAFVAQPMRRKDRKKPRDTLHCQKDPIWGHFAPPKPPQNMGMEHFAPPKSTLEMGMGTHCKEKMGKSVHEQYVMFGL